MLPVCLGFEMFPAVWWRGASYRKGAEQREGRKAGRQPARRRVAMILQG